MLFTVITLIAIRTKQTSVKRTIFITVFAKVFTWNLETRSVCHKYCYDFQKGKRTRENCRRKHAKMNDPKPKCERKRSDSKGRDQDRSALRKRAGLKKIPSRFFKGGQGNRARGAKFAFSHEVNAAAPAIDSCGGKQSEKEQQRKVSYSKVERQKAFPEQEGRSSCGSLSA